MEAVPEDWQDGLVIAAHPDDIEYGAAAAVARWTGRQTGALRPRDERGGRDRRLDPEECGPLREAEERESRGSSAWTRVE
ncbi:GlcNAc-PI de-N-acetylase, partial [Rhodococcus sp. IITR03]